MAARRRIRIGPYSFGLPGSRAWRLVIGILLVLCGLVGFLPILGFWMVPLGFLVLSVDLPIVRRARRRVEVWWGRRNRPKDNPAV
jgi:hypothetical protein